LVCYDGAPDHPTIGRLASLIERHRVTHFGASPTLVRALAGAATDPIGSASSTSIRTLMVAGEVIDPEHFTWFFRTFGRGEVPVINYTGGTEASGALLGNVPVRPIKASAFNTSSPGVQAYVADANGRRVKEQVGELTIGAPFIGMTRGFWHDDARYLESYWNVVAGVWTHGDFAYEDSDGQFFILGRSDDTLKIAGKRVGPAEIEAVLLELPELREVAAIGVPDQVKGQRLVICAVPASDSEPDLLATMLSDRIEAALGKPFRPAQIYFVANLPKTRNGKIMRRVIRNILSQQPLGDLSSLENPESIQLLRALQKQGSSFREVANRSTRA
jgi:acetyl-CoA synthetase